MATQLLAPGNNSASSADFEVSDAPVTVSLFTAGSGSIGYSTTVHIQIKASNGQYTTVGSVTDDEPAVLVVATGTYRVTRAGNGGTAVGVDRS